MSRLLLILFLVVATNNVAVCQSNIDKILTAEHAAGHFNGAVLVLKNGQVVAQASKGMANLQFAVPIDSNTRFPIASMTKTLTAVLVLQLVEKGQLQLEDKVVRYIADLPAGCHNITILDLLTHYSGLKNEPIEAYARPYSPAQFVKEFVSAKEGPANSAFSYNNVDYILLTRVLEVIAQKSYRQLLQDNIFGTLGMANSGLIAEATVVPGLAYGYHNYSFGTGKKDLPLKNDPLWYLSNYGGAGGVFSTTGDLLKLVQGLRENKLLTAASTAQFMTMPQKKAFIEEARGYPTIGFYYNRKKFAQPVLERRGSINGFNSVLLVDTAFRKVVIILANTDTGDLELIGDKIYAELE